MKKLTRTIFTTITALALGALLINSAASAPRKAKSKTRVAMRSKRPKPALRQCLPVASVFDAQNNAAKLEISGILSKSQVVVVSGPGWEFERVKGYHPNGTPKYSLGAAQELAFQFDVTDVGVQKKLNKYFQDFDTGKANSKSFSLIVPRIDGKLAFRINAHGFLPEKAALVNGRKRYSFNPPALPDRIKNYQMDGMKFGSTGSNNPTTDTLTEISGITKGLFFPKVTDNATKNQITFEYDYAEGAGIYKWVLQAVKGIENKRSLSVIKQNQAGKETSRRNYYEVFPIRYQILSGFGQKNKIRARVVLSYDKAELAAK